MRVPTPFSTTYDWYCILFRIASIVPLPGPVSQSERAGSPGLTDIIVPDLRMATTTQNLTPWQSPRSDPSLFIGLLPATLLQPVTVPVILRPASSGRECENAKDLRVTNGQKGRTGGGGGGFGAVSILDKFP